jgi:DNA polymerase III delta prime subunit
MISKHLDKNNLHHAYLIEGAREEIVPEIFAFCEDLNIKTSGNPDFCRIAIDNFKIEEAFSLRSMSSDKGFTSLKKVYVISVNTITLDAQNVLLKMFEEPNRDTHFFVIVPDANALLETLVSRFYLIRSNGTNTLAKEAEDFIGMSLKNRIDYIKNLLADPEEEDEEGNEIAVLDSTRSKALKFLNAVEAVLHGRIRKGIPDTEVLEHIFRVREFLRMPGSSAKMLMESVALSVPNL